MEDLTYYDVLEVPESATLEEIKSSYRRLVKEYHPDTIPEQLRARRIGQDAAETFKLIQQAYEVLASSEQRLRYDRELRDLRTASSQPAHEAPAESAGQQTPTGRRSSGSTGSQSPPPPPPSSHGSSATSWQHPPVSGQQTWPTSKLLIGLSLLVLGAAATMLATLWVLSGQQSPNRRHSIDGASLRPGPSSTVRPDSGPLLLREVGSTPLRGKPTDDLMVGVALSAAGDKMAASYSGSTGGTVRVWDTRSGSLLMQRRLSIASEGGMAFDRSSTRLAVGDSHGHVRVWDLGGKDQSIMVDGHAAGVTAVAFAPDGTSLASADQGGEVLLHQLPSGRSISSLSGHSDPVHTLVFSPNGRLLASGSGGAFDYTVRLWSVDGKGELHRITAGGLVKALAFSIDGEQLAMAGWDRVSTWALPDVRWMVTLPWESRHQPVTSLAFDPSAQLLATSHGDGAINLWDTRTGGVLERLAPRDSLYYGAAIAFESDGRTLMAAREEVVRWRYELSK